MDGNLINEGIVDGDIIYVVLGQYETLRLPWYYLTIIIVLSMDYYVYYWSLEGVMLFNEFMFHDTWYYVTIIMVL